MSAEQILNTNLLLCEDTSHIVTDGSLKSNTDVPGLLTPYSSKICGKIDHKNVLDRIETSHLLPKSFIGQSSNVVANEDCDIEHDDAYSWPDDAQLSIAHPSMLDDGDEDNFVISPDLYQFDSDNLDKDLPISSQDEIASTQGKPFCRIQGTDITGKLEDLKPELDHPQTCDPRTDFFSACHKAADQAEELVHRVWEAGWRVVHHHTLPKWLKDNDFLIMGHRPPTHSFLECFKSVFRIHTETGNIWTHLLGFIAFVVITFYFLTRPSIEIQIQEKAVFSPFFFGAILCLGFSTLFHTLYCHSEKVGKLFNKLDYCGISLLTMGSFVPWLYYSFYCRIKPKITYLVLIFILGTCSIIVSLWDKFATPQYRVLRAGVFIALGLSGVIPALHYVITDGFYHAITFASLGWLLLMAVLYIAGAVIYAARIPERLFPGKFDIWFQSHQIFHVFVVAAAFVHYHGISEIATYRLTTGDCVQTDVN